MSDFRYEVEIRVPPARVWAVLLDVERWPEWTTSVSRIQRMEMGSLTIGSRARIWQPRLRPAVWRVTSLDERRRIFAWTTRTLGSTALGHHQVDAFKNHSRVILSIKFTGPLSSLITRLYGKLTQDYLVLEGDGLKKYCENLPASHPAMRPPDYPRASAQSS